MDYIEYPDLHLADPQPSPEVKEMPIKLTAWNWLEKVSGSRDFNFVQVQFKNTRNSFYDNYLHLDLKPGDMVAVEAAQGHDIGTVLMTGRLVGLQMKKANLHSNFEVRKIFRKAHKSDIEKYEEAKSREHDTMIRSRKIAESLGLSMKIGDVEYQGDGGKAIFYYIANERVDFRKLIRIFADTFKVRIEMKQIGARQEAGRIGGVGPCGRPLCCATWLSHFVSVGTSAARFQDLSMNPQKLAGMCDKLKCCLNYEVDTYMEAQRKLPHKDITLETRDQTYYYFKADILNHIITYSTDKHQPVNTVSIDSRRAFEIIALNKQGVKPERLDDGKNDTTEERGFFDLAEQDSLTRFDKAKKKKKKKKPQAQQPAAQPKQQGQPKQHDKNRHGNGHQANGNARANHSTAQANNAGHGDANPRKHTFKHKPRHGAKQNNDGNA